MQIGSYILLFALVASASSLKGQDLHHDYVGVADSLLLDIVGKDNFNDYFLLDATSSYYDYETKEGVKEQGDFKQKMPAKSRIICYYLYYQLDLPAYGYSNSLALHINCDLTNNLPKVKHLIPGFMFTGDPPNLITKEEAEMIAMSHGFKYGVQDWVFDLDFNEKYKTLAWGIYNMVGNEGESTMVDKKWNAIEIDAVTGQVLHTYKYVADL